MMLAIKEGHVSLSKWLLERRAKVDPRNEFGETALMLAAAGGDLSLVKHLVTYGARINIEGWSPLIYAAWRGHTEVVRYLLDNGADIDAVSANGTSALMMASAFGQFETVKLLLWKVADPNLKTDSGGTALQWAIRAKNTDIAALLRQAGAEE